MTPELRRARAARVRYCQRSAPDVHTRFRAPPPPDPASGPGAGALLLVILGPALLSASVAFLVLTLASILHRLAVIEHLMLTAPVQVPFQ